MDGAPVAGDVQPAADPDAIARRDIVQEALQRHDAARPAQQAAMHADAEHLGGLVAFGVERVEAVLQVLEEGLGVGIALRQREAHVVAVQRVGHDQLRHDLAVASAHLHPERQVVAVVVAVVFEAAIVGHQPARAGAVAAGIPAQRARTGQLFDGLHAQEHVFALGGLVHVLVVHPAPAVAGDLVAQLDAGRGQFGMALQGHAHAEHRQRQPPLLELAQDAPDAGARAIFVDALHGRWRSG